MRKLLVLTVIAIIPVYTAAFPFSSAESAGRAGVYTSGNKDIIQNPSLAGMNKNYFIDAEYLYSENYKSPFISVSIPFTWGVWGNSFRYLTGDGDKSMLLSTAVSREIYPFFSLGLSLDYMNVTKPSKNYFAGGSFGFSYFPAVYLRTSNDFGFIEPQFSASYRAGYSSGDDKKLYDLTSINAVFAFSFYKDAVSKFSFYQKGEYLKQDKKIPLSSGLEYTFKNFISVRTGLLFEDKSDYSGWTAGAGIDSGFIKGDYAFSKTDQKSHYVSLSLNIASVDVEPPSVEMKALPAYISPNYDGQNDYSVIGINVSDKSDIKGWIFQINSDDGKPVKEYRSDDRSLDEKFSFGIMLKRIFGSKAVLKVPQNILWDGSDSTGTKLKDGAYPFSFICWDEFDNYSEKKTGYIVIDNKAPSMEISADTLLFSPNGDGKKDSVVIIQKAVGESSDIWKGSIRDALGNEIRTYTWNTASIPQVIKWDGRNQSGADVPEGLYSYRLESTDNAGNSSSKEIKEISLSRGYESADISSSIRYFSYNSGVPVLFSTYLSKTAGLRKWKISVISDDDNAVRLFEGTGFLPGGIEWDGLDNLGKRIPDGKYYYNLSSEFDSGNTPVSFKKEIILDSTAPKVSIKCGPVPFSPDGDGEDDVLRINLSSEEFSGISEWSVSIYNPTGFLFKKFSGKDFLPSEIIWDGRGTSGELVESADDYSAVFSAIDKAGNMISSKPVKIPVDILVVVTERGLKIKISSIEFAFGSDKLNQKGYGILDRVSEILKKYSSYSVIVEGHTDDVGDDNFNLKLSEMRAKVVYDYLVSEGVAQDRLSFRGMGETMPYLPNKDEESRRKNRRVEFLLEKKRE
ncbi:MAG: OmpA family protein [Spirochaetes bacterium]|nr:OmpA family protein [Spirochaetota bacterium]